MSDDQARLGDRLRKIADTVPGFQLYRRLREIADAVDLDAKTDTEALRFYILGQISEIVKRLRYTIGRYPDEDRDVLDADALLEALDKIFGASPGPQASERFINRDYWSGDHRPYRNVLHDLSDKPADWFAVRERLFAEAGIRDGDVFEVIVRRTGERPFSTVWRRTKPHVYEPVEETP